MFEQFPALAAIPGLRHGISTRLGGVSEGAFASLNLGYHVEDDPSCVTENRRRFAAIVGYDPMMLVTAQQIHGTAIAFVSPADCGRGAFSWDDALPATDGLIVADPLVPVAIQVADCAPVLIVDPQQRALAVVHAGWRGALGRIASAAVDRLCAQCGSAAVDLIVGIGPALCRDCLEVGEEVAGMVEDAFGTSVVSRDTRPHLDLAGMITADLLAAGIPESRISRHAACTKCRQDRFFSHRGQQGQAGRLMLTAWWQ